MANCRNRNPGQITTSIGLTLAAVSMMTLVRAQEQPPSVDAGAAASARREFTRRATPEKASTLLARLETLATREEQLLEKVDYDGLITLEEERVTVLSELTTAGLPSERIKAAGAIILSPDEARLSGDVTRMNPPSEQGLTRWGETGSASWQIDEIIPGYYAIQIVYSSPEEPEEPDQRQPEPGNPGVNVSADIIICGEASHFVSNTERLLTRTIKPAGPPDDIRSSHLGTLVLTEPSASIQLRVAETRGGGIMNLKAVYLIRTARPAPDPKSAITSTAPGLDLIREEHRKTILELREPIDQDYLRQLSLLHENLEKQGRDEAARAVIEEKTRLDAARSALTSEKPDRE